MNPALLLLPLLGAAALGIGFAGCAALQQPPAPQEEAPAPVQPIQIILEGLEGGDAVSQIIVLRPGESMDGTTWTTSVNLNPDKDTESEGPAAPTTVADLPDDEEPPEPSDDAEEMGQAEETPNNESAEPQEPVDDDEVEQEQTAATDPPAPPVDATASDPATMPGQAPPPAPAT